MRKPSPRVAFYLLLGASCYASMRRETIGSTLVSRINRLCGLRLRFRGEGEHSGDKQIEHGADFLRSGGEVEVGAAGEDLVSQHALEHPDERGGECWRRHFLGERGVSGEIGYDLFDRCAETQIAGRNQNVRTGTCFANASAFEQHELFQRWVALKGLKNQFKNHAQLVRGRRQDTHSLGDELEILPAVIEDGFEQSFLAPEMLDQLRFACICLARNGGGGSVLKSMNREQNFPCFKQTFAHRRGAIYRLWVRRGHLQAHTSRTAALSQTLLRLRLAVTLLTVVVLLAMRAMLWGRIETRECRQRDTRDSEHYDNHERVTAMLMRIEHYEAPRICGESHRQQ
jgi:hypothetical protein